MEAAAPSDIDEKRELARANQTPYNFIAQLSTNDYLLLQNIPGSLCA
jgi:hypothetical protein